MKTYVTRKIGEISNGLKVETILRHEKGIPVYGCFCTECGTRGVPVRHDKWEVAKCLSSTHGREKFKPVTLREIRQAEVAEEQRQRDTEEAKVREAETNLTATHQKIHELVKKAVVDGRPDPDFGEIPDRIRNRRMTVKQALAFNEAESRRFVEETPDYYRCDKNSKTITDYLWNQGVQIPDAEAYKLAFTRCRSLGLLVEPAPEPITVEQPEPNEPEQKQDDGSVDGFDLNSGEPRRFTQAEIWKMSSSDLKKAFKMWVGKDGEDRRALVKWSMYR
jgi:hypothetical protein